MGTLPGRRAPQQSGAQCKILHLPSLLVVLLSADDRSEDNTTNIVLTMYLSLEDNKEPSGLPHAFVMQKLDHRI